MAVREYVGARYVPLFADDPWTSTIEYEPLTVVLHEGNSFTSRQYVPVGIDISNETYWTETGNYNAQVEAYRKEVLSLKAAAARSYATVSAMKADANISEGNVLQTLGYTAEGDDGGAVYVATASGTPTAGTVIALDNGLFANLVLVMPYVTPEMFGAVSNPAVDAAPAINLAIQSGYEVVLGKKTYYIQTPILVDRAVRITGQGYPNTIIRTAAAINAINIRPTALSVGPNGFDMGNFALNGGNVGVTAISYDNQGVTENFISRWLIHDIKIDGFTQAVNFNNQEVNDGYFLGGFERVYCGCPLDFYRSGDSWFIRDSNFYDNAKVTVHSIAPGARSFSFENNNYTAPGFSFTGNGLVFEKNQMEPSTLPAVSVTGYNCVISNSSINGHGDEAGSYQLEFSNNTATPNLGTSNLVIGCSLVSSPNRQNIVKSNDKVSIIACSWSISTGATIADRARSQYVSGALVDYSSDWQMTPGENITLGATANAFYQDGWLNIWVSGSLENASLANDTVLVDISPAVISDRETIIPAMIYHIESGVFTNTPAHCSCLDGHSIRLACPASTQQQVSNFYISAQLKTVY